MNNQNHPFINALGGVGGNSSNIHILDNMLSFQTAAAVEQGAHKPGLIPQYSYQDIQGLHAHHAMNLVAAPHVATVASTVDTAALYQEQQQQHQQQQLQQQHHQQQPISYKIPHVGGTAVTVVAQEQPAHMSLNLPEKKKDIVAEALREQKIFDDEVLHHKQQAAAAAAAAAQQAAVMAAAHHPAPATSHAAVHGTLVTAVKSEPTHVVVTATQESTEPQASTPVPESVAGPSSSVRAVVDKDEKPTLKVASTGTVTTATATATTTGTSTAITSHTTAKSVVNQTRTVNRHLPRQPIMPRLQLLDDEDDGLTCRLCLHAFWYKSQLSEHLKSAHSISDPVKFEREEREKKLRRIREEQHRIAAAKRQRLGVAAMAAQRGMLRGRGGNAAGMNARQIMVRGGGHFRPGHPMRGGRPVPTGPRPSFQYRDGAFICDLCKKSFSDGNDMVSHWKSHVKQQARGISRGAMMANRAAAAAAAAANRKTAPVVTRGRGRPPKTMSSSQRHSMSSSTSRGRGRGSSRGRSVSERGGKRKGKGRAKRKDKGKPRWTAYLLWSTRKRKQICKENPEFTFAQVGKAISEGWKEIKKEEVEVLKEEADHLNKSNLRKLPKKPDSDEDSEDDEDEVWNSEEEDPSFDETNVKKPIMLKIKRDGEAKPKRTQKRPSFFQEFEDEENNLDKILDEFEMEQIEESKNPDAAGKKKPVIKNPGSRPRKRREPSLNEDDEDVGPVELETSRSGRVRKKPKFYDYSDGEGENNSKSDDDKDDYRPESEEEPEEEEVDSGEEEAGAEEGADGGSNTSLPPKKRLGRPPKLDQNKMSKKETEAAIKAALAARPMVVLSQENVSEKEECDASDEVGAGDHKIKQEDANATEVDSEDANTTEADGEDAAKVAPEDVAHKKVDGECDDVVSNAKKAVEEDVSLDTPCPMEEGNDEEEHQEEGSTSEEIDGTCKDLHDVSKNASSSYDNLMEESEQVDGNPVGTNEQDCDNPIEKLEEDGGNPLEENEQDDRNPLEENEQEVGNPLEENEEVSGNPLEENEQEVGNPFEENGEGSGNPLEENDEGSGNHLVENEEGSGNPLEENEQHDGNYMEEGGSNPLEENEDGDEENEEGDRNPLEEIEQGSHNSLEEHEEGSSNPLEEVEQGSSNPFEEVEQGSGNPSEEVEQGSGNPLEENEQICGNPLEENEQICGNPLEENYEHCDGSATRPSKNPLVESEQSCGNPLEEDEEGSINPLAESEQICGNPLEENYEHGDGSATRPSNDVQGHVNGEEDDAKDPFEDEGGEVCENGDKACGEQTSSRVVEVLPPPTDTAGKGVLSSASADADGVDILTSATEQMEEGDEQYKNMIAETQMDNIFN